MSAGHMQARIPKISARTRAAGLGGSSAPSLDVKNGGEAATPKHRATERAIHLACFS